MLLDLVAELAERHVQEFGGLGLDTSGALESQPQVLLLHAIQGCVEVKAVLRKIRLDVAHDTGPPEVLG